MDNIVAKYASMEGRLDRTQWWISALILLIAHFIMTWFFATLAGISLPLDLTQAADPLVVQRAGWIGVVTTALFAYPFLAISVKRRHDRGNDGRDAVGFVALALIFNLLTGFGWTSNIFGGILGFALLCYGAYMLVQLGVKGSAETDTNRQPADPLSAA